MSNARYYLNTTKTRVKIVEIPADRLHGEQPSFYGEVLRVDPTSRWMCRRGFGRTAQSGWKGVAMRERPILFSGEMVRAILAGEKTQTRRVVKPQPDPYDGDGVPARFCSGWQWPSAKCRSMVDVRDIGSLGPYGKPGDRLWVREAWRPRIINHGISGAEFGTVQYLADWSVLPYERVNSPAHQSCVRHWIGGAGSKTATGDLVGKGRPSIHMPRWASRITLEVTGVRVERVRDISEADAEAEGVDFDRLDTFVDEYGRTEAPPVRVRRGPKGAELPPSAEEAFASLWDSINAKRPGSSWKDNPWTWVLEFKRAEDKANA